MIGDDIRLSIDLGALRRARRRRTSSWSRFYVNGWQEVLDVIALVYLDVPLALLFFTFQPEIAFDSASYMAQAESLANSSDLRSASDQITRSALATISARLASLEKRVLARLSKWMPLTLLPRPA